jgi:hypothetical protein
MENQFFIITSSVKTGSSQSKEKMKKSKDKNGLSGVKKDCSSVYNYYMQS